MTNEVVNEQGEQMNNKGPRMRRRFRVERTESCGREAGIHNERERVSYRRAVSTMGFMILRGIISVMRNSF